MNTLVIAEHDNQTIADATKKALSAAIALGKEVHLLVAGENCADAVADAANIDGVAKVLKADDAAFAKLLAELLAASEEQSRSRRFGARATAVVPAAYAAAPSPASNAGN